jgi:hypothetical protein
MHSIDPDNMTGNVDCIDHIDAICDEFEIALDGGREPLTEDSLAKAGEDQKDIALRELLLVEIEYYMRGHRVPPWMDYNRRFESVMCRRYPLRHSQESTSAGLFPLGSASLIQFEALTTRRGSYCWRSPVANPIVSREHLHLRRDIWRAPVVA